MSEDKGYIYCPKCGFMVSIDWTINVAENFMKLGPIKIIPKTIAPNGKGMILGVNPNISEEEIGRLSENPDAKVWLQDCGLKVTMPTRFGWKEYDGDTVGLRYTKIDEYIACKNKKEVTDFSNYNKALKEWNSDMIMRMREDE